MNVWESIVDLGKTFLKVFMYYWAVIMVIVFSGYIVSWIVGVFV